MSVIPLTVFFSLLLAGTFVVLFAREQRRRHLTSPERDSLLPLADEIPVAAGGTPRPRGFNLRDRSSVASANDEAQVPPTDHDHACGCRAGSRPPCAGCLQRRDEQDPAHF